jgi:hypothetical protein
MRNKPLEFYMWIYVRRQTTRVSVSSVENMLLWIGIKMVAVQNFDEISDKLGGEWIWKSVNFEQ